MKIICGEKVKWENGICTVHCIYEFVWMSSKITEQSEQMYMPDPKANVRLVQHTWQTKNQCYKQLQMPIT